MASSAVEAVARDQNEQHIRLRSPTLGPASPTVSGSHQSNETDATLPYQPRKGEDGDLFAQTEKLLVKPVLLRSVAELHQSQRSFTAPPVPTIQITPSDNDPTRIPLPISPLPFFTNATNTIQRVPVPEYTTANAQEDEASVSSRRSDISRRSSLLSRSSSATFSPQSTEHTQSRSLRSRSQSPFSVQETEHTLRRVYTDETFATTTSQHSRLTQKFPVRFALSKDFATSDPLIWADTELEQEEITARNEKWTPYKWTLLLTMILMFVYGLLGIIVAFRVWLNTWPHAQIAKVCNHGLVASLTIAGIACILTAILGLMGVILNSRRILSIYALLLWPVFLTILIVGYSAYHKAAFSLDLKLNQAWSQFYSDLDRLRIQNMLSCCGYYGPLHDATYSQRCYPRSILPGCKSRLYQFESSLLRQYYTSAFAIVPFHIFNICAAVVCANHVNRTLGKGHMPAPYRLTIHDVNDFAAMSQYHALKKDPYLDDAHSDASSIKSMPQSPSRMDLKGLGLHA